MKKNCSNPNCDAMTNRGRMCSPCYSYQRSYGRERPRELCLYPNRGHNFALSSDVCAMTGATYRQLDWLVRDYGFEPTISVEGSGFRRGYTVDDVVQVNVLIYTPSEHRPKDIDPRAKNLRIDIADNIWMSVDIASIRKDVIDKWPEGRDMELETK